MKHARTLSLLFVLLLGFSAKIFADEGEKLFKGNCAVCHTVGKGKLVGPDLKNIGQKHEEAWLLKWIKSSQELVKAGDQKAVQIFNDNGNVPMPDATINEEEIKAVLAFIKNKSEAPEAAVKKSIPVAAPAHTTAAHDEPGSLLTIFTFGEYIMLMLLALLIVVIWVLGMAVKTLSEKIK